MQMFGKLGLFLIPSGLLNENHEPTTFYGVLRNRVETAIIPTTWREGGALVQATTEGGLRWDVGVTTGFDLSKWDPASPEGLESPLGSIHQELALAKASDLSGIAAVNYTGVPGLRLGASIFRGDASQGQAGFDDNVVTLWEAHGTWTPGRFEFAALYANGHISNTAKVNATFVGNPTLDPRGLFWLVRAGCIPPARLGKRFAPPVHTLRTGQHCVELRKHRARADAVGRAGSRYHHYWCELPVRAQRRSQSRLPAFRRRSARAIRST